MTIQVLTQQPDDWNTYLADSPYGDILQTWEWGEVKKDELWQPHRIRLTEGQTILGQAQILVRQLPGGFKLYYMPRGPVLDYQSSQAKDILKQLLDWTSAHAKKNRGLFIKISPAVEHQQAPNVALIFDQLHLKHNSHPIQMQYTRTIPLQGSDADVLASFDKDTRNLVRRAAKEGVVVDHFDQADDTKGLRTFHNMYLSTADRGNFPARSWQQTLKLWQIMAPQGMAHLYTASWDDQPMASSLVLQLGPTAYQLWSGSRRDISKKYATYALQWTIMQHMKSRGVTNYDMWGRAPTEDPKHPWSGPTLFKKGFKGREITFVGDYDKSVSPLFPIFSLASNLRQQLYGPKASKSNKPAKSTPAQTDAATPQNSHAPDANPD